MNFFVCAECADGLGDQASISTNLPVKPILSHRDRMDQFLDVSGRILKRAGIRRKDCREEVEEVWASIPTEAKYEWSRSEGEDIVVRTAETLLQHTFFGSNEVLRCKIAQALHVMTGRPTGYLESAGLDSPDPSAPAKLRKTNSQYSGPQPPPVQPRRSDPQLAFQEDQSTRAVGASISQKQRSTLLISSPTPVTKTKPTVALSSRKPRLPDSIADSNKYEDDSMSYSGEKHDTPQVKRSRHEGHRTSSRH